MKKKQFMTDNKNKISAVAKLIKESTMTVALTGAGISVESGIDPFRGEKGLWAKYNPEEYAYIDAFYENPAKVWQMLKELLAIIIFSKPNNGHVGLAQLEEMGYLSSIITQNVDGLHQAAGSRNVIEFHGNNRWLLCIECSNRYETDPDIIKNIPPRCECGGILRPDVVFFGEAIPQKAMVKAYANAKSCDVMLVIGTSAIVSPASEIPLVAKDSGAKIIEINPEPTPLTDQVANLTIYEKAGTTIPMIVSELKKKS